MKKFRCCNFAFTLIELLVVIAIITLLVGMLAPVLGKAKLLARVAKVHSELRGVTLAIQMYGQDNEDEIPPTRGSCSTQTAYDMPVELGSYFPQGRKNGVEVVALHDPFDDGETYRYRCVGAMIQNESTIIPNGSSLWIPQGFPYDDENTTSGSYCNDPEKSPVRYALWSVGPNPQSAKFDIPGRTPLPRKYWLLSGQDEGVIVHYQATDGAVYTSP